MRGTTAQCTANSQRRRFRCLVRIHATCPASCRWTPFPPSRNGDCKSVTGQTANPRRCAACDPVRRMRWCRMNAGTTFGGTPTALEQTTLSVHGAHVSSARVTHASSQASRQHKSSISQTALQQAGSLQPGCWCASRQPPWAVSHTAKPPQTPSVSTEQVSSHCTSQQNGSSSHTSSQQATSAQAGVSLGEKQSPAPSPHAPTPCVGSLSQYMVSKPDPWAPENPPMRMRYSWLRLAANVTRDGIPRSDPQPSSSQVTSVPAGQSQPS